MNNLNKILIIIAIVVAVAVSAFIYFNYIGDNTYEDERISINIPAGTEFNITAENINTTGFSQIVYNDSSDKNIVIRMIMVPDTSILGMSVKDITLNAHEKSILNESYSVVKITENYTIYKNNETGRYNALIKNPGFNGYVLIGCNGVEEDIVKLAESFKFKSYTTDGLSIINVKSNTTNTTNTSNTVSNSGENTDNSLASNENKESNNSNPPHGSAGHECDPGDSSCRIAYNREQGYSDDYDGHTY